MANKEIDSYTPREVSEHPAFIKLTKELAKATASYEAAKIVIQQHVGEARRAWPNGRVSAEDDGQLGVSIGVDKSTREVSFEFGKSVKWFSMSPEMAIEISLKLYDVADKILNPPQDDED